MLRRAGAFMMAALLLSGCDEGPVTPPGQVDQGEATADVRTGYLLDGSGRPVQVTYTVFGGRAIWQGDIDLGPADRIPSEPPRPAADGPSRLVFWDDTFHRWPGGVIPYRIAPNFPAQWRPYLTWAIAHIETRVPGIDFRPHAGEADFLEIIRSDQPYPDGTVEKICTSPVGRIGGAQTVRLGEGCLNKGIFAHELLHAAGMFHEHMRCDRDAYIRVNLNAVQVKYRGAFDRVCADGLLPVADALEYDEGSITHYGPYDFRRRLATTPVIVSLRGRDDLMGQRDSMSVGDITAMNMLYPAQVPVQRWYSYPRRDHFYTLNTGPIADGSYVLEQFGFFYLGRLNQAASGHFKLLYGCYVSRHNYVSADPNCEAGVAARKVLGRAATWQMEGTEPLYRTRAPDTGDRLMTWEKWERDMTLSWGWIDEGIVGYVWPRRPE
ncbi:MAG TPA: M12 family metallopeptidase [Longimicrobium sp.]|nr:M12 family metallopeptidase [Longimicrobium sp.]